jgi:ribosome-associated translation inhibitor RaiA
MELEIQSRNLVMTPRWKTEIEARMSDLQRGHEDVVHGRVTLAKNRRNLQETLTGHIIREP